MRGGASVSCAIAIASASAITIALAGACSGSAAHKPTTSAQPAATAAEPTPEAPPAAVGQQGIVSRLPAAPFMMGLNPQGDAAELRNAFQFFQPLAAAQGVSIPACLVEVLISIRGIAIAVRPNETPVVAVTGSGGLRKVFEGCAGELLAASNDELEVQEVGTVTLYVTASLGAHVLWLDDDTMVLGPIVDAKGTAALAAGGGTLPVGEIDPVASFLWGEMVPSALTSAALPFMGDDARVRRLWFWIPPEGALAGHAVAEMASKEDATHLARDLNTKLAQSGSAFTASGVTIKVHAEGDRVLGDMDATAMLARSLGGEKEITPSMRTMAVLGMVAAILIPAYAKAQQRPAPAPSP